jgi:aldose 1-epimerase
MARFELEADGVRAEIDSAIGGGLADFSIRSPIGDWTPVMRRARFPAGRSEDLGCFTMLPWPNRVRGGVMHWRGRDIDLGPNFPDGTAIHGEVRERAWAIRHRTPQSAVLEFDSREQHGLTFPWAYLGRIRYEVSPEGLEIDVSVTNLADEAGPFGHGIHPYFMRRLWADEDGLVLRFAATGHYPTRGVMPTGPAASDAACGDYARGIVPPPGLDELFAVDAFAAELDWPGSGVRVRFAADGAANHAALYTPSAAPGRAGNWLCFEPMTMATDAVNIDAAGIPGARVCVLEPGQTLAMACTLGVERC